MNPGGSMGEEKYISIYAIHANVSFFTLRLNKGCSKEIKSVTLNFGCDYLYVALVLL